jgi:predicted TIM-barrel fold metal-dependent hydrolase
MDHFGIAEAMVQDALGRENHPQEGNVRVLEAVAQSPRLHAAWAALPPGARDEQLDGAEFVAAMRRNKVAAVWLLPGQYRFNLTDWCIDELLEPLAAARVPVFICHDEVSGWPTRQDQTDWPAVVALCRRWPKLPVIVSEWRIRRSQRVIYRALDACPNLRVEMSGYYLFRGVEYITRRWGSGRLIFGSNWPTFGHGQTLAILTRAEIADNDKRAIAGGNMRRLMSWCRPKHPAVPVQPPADEYVAIGRGSAVPEKLRFWDCHGHLGGKACHYHIPDGDIDATMAEVRRQGVDKACVFSFAGVFSDEAHGNDLVADAVRRYPDVLVGFTLVNPHRGPAAMLAELERGAAMGLRGVKLIPHYQGYPQEGPNIDVACRWAHEHRQIILNHYWGPAAHLERLIRRYPRACYVTGHTTTEYAALMKKRRNLYVCSCPLWDGPRACEHMVAAIGADRLMFGSDLQDLPIAWGLGPILFARLSVKEKAMILGGNLRRVLAEYSLRP